MSIRLPCVTGLCAIFLTVACNGGSGTAQGAEGSGDNGQPYAPANASPIGASAHDEAIVSEIGRELANKRSATYSHTTYVDEASGVYDYDCSGFIGYALDHAYPAGMAAIRSATIERPLAKHFESFFSSLSSSDPAWAQVPRAIDLRPGDIIAWLEPADVQSNNTGHVMFVYGAPYASSTRNEIIVPVADATSSPHGGTDARTAAGETGLGTGAIGLVVDGAGAPTGYYWNGGSSPTSHATAIALGRAR
jgi:hypothetical protein